MSISTAFGSVEDVATSIRSARRLQHLTQSQLAAKAGVSRSFIIELEVGHTRAQIGKVFDVIHALGLKVELLPEASEQHASPTRTQAQLKSSLAAIEKGQQMAGHFPSAEAMDRAERILQGTTSPEQARAELAAKYGQLRS